MRKLGIGAVTAFRCDSWGATPDDRQTLVKCINKSIVVDDQGVCEAGEIYNAEAVFREKDWEIVKRYWRTREKVDVRYQNDAFGKCRVVVKGWKSIDDYPNYYSVTLEFWRV